MSASAARQYNLTLLILAALTAAEWCAFLHKGGNPFIEGQLVPLLLMMSAIKFGVVVLWFVRRRAEPTWGQKILLVTFVVAGGLILAPYVLLVRH